MVFLLVGLFLAVTWDWHGITDTELNHLQTKALVTHGDIDISRYDRTFMFALEHNDDLYSIYGVGVSLVAAPIYLALTKVGVDARVMEGTVGILFTAGSAALFYVLLARLFDRRIAVGGTIVFVFGTTMWPLASTAFYQHAPVAFLQILALLAFFARDERAPLRAGLAMGAAFFVRPTQVVLAATMGFLYLSEDRRKVARFTLGALPFFLGLLIQNRWIWGSWLEGGYARSGVGYHAFFGQAIGGQTIGWWRGMFIYSPFLILGVVGLVEAGRRRGWIEKRIIAIAAGSILLLLFYSRWDTWWNGLHQFGYRYQLDFVPLIVLMVVYAIHVRPALVWAAAPLVGISILTMSAGMGSDPDRWDPVLYPKSVDLAPIGRAWSAFLDRPWGTLVRFAGVFLVGAALLLATRRDRGRDNAQATDDDKRVPYPGAS